MADLQAKSPGDAIAVPGPGGRDPGRTAPARSLRTRAFLAILGLLAYVLAALFYVSMQRSAIRDSVMQLQQLAHYERALSVAGAALDAVQVEVSEAGRAGADQQLEAQELALLLETSDHLLGSLGQFDPGYTRASADIDQAYHALVAAPLRANWIELREAVARTAAGIDDRQRQLGLRRDTLMQSFRHRYDAVTVDSLGLALVGVVAFGYIVVTFFAQLTRDIRRLEVHARRIVHGERNITLPVTRRDEVGSLMGAVNRLAVDLDRQEQRLELEHQRRAHQDKMTAIGALAAGVAHEINNALTVIVGHAQELGEPPRPCGAARQQEIAAAVLAQAQRAAQSARRLAEMAQPQPAARGWIDVNLIVQHVVELMRYDRRYRAMRFDGQWSPALPAVHSSGEVVQHAVTRLLSLCADAAAARGPAGAIARVATTPAAAGDAVNVEATFQAALDLEDPPIQRSLLLTRSIIEPLGGRLVLTPGEGPSLQVVLTVPVGAAGGAGPERYV